MGQTIGKNYEQFCRTMSPTATGGLMNYFLQPTKDPTTQEYKLKVSEVDIVGTMKEYFLSSEQELRVYEILPDDAKSGEIADRHYFEALIAGGVAIVLAILFFLTTLIVPCVFKCGRRGAKQFSKYKSIAYLVLGILVLLLVAFLVLCIPVAFVATNHFVSGISPTKAGGGKSELTERLDIVFNGTKALMNEMLENGNKTINVTLDNVQSAIKDKVTPMIGKMMDQLLERYGAFGLLSDLKNINGSVGGLKVTSEYVSNNINDTIKVVEDFKKRMNDQQKKLVQSFNNLCSSRNDPEEIKKKCEEIQKNLGILEIKFDPSKVTEGPASLLMEKTDELAKNLSEITEKFDKTMDEVKQKADEVTKKVESELNFNEQFESLTKVWNQLDADYKQPMDRKLDEIRPQIDDNLKLPGILATAVGYSVAAIFACTILVLTIYVIICLIDAIRQGFWPFGHRTKRRPMRTMPACGFVLPVLLSVLTPVLIIIAVVLVLVTSVVNNEACRYVSQTEGIDISSAVLDIYLKSEWTTLVPTESLDPKYKDMLNLPAPKNALKGLLVNCDPRNTPDASLLPLVGINNVVNVTEVTNQPDLVKALKDNKDTLVKEVENLNLAQFFPKDMDELNNTITNIAGNLTSADYTESIKELANAIPGPEQLSPVLDEIAAFADSVPNGNGEVEEIKKTVEEMKKLLTEIPNLKTQVLGLTDAFENLQTFKAFAEKLEQFLAKMKSVKEILESKEEIRKPIDEVYDAGVNETFSKLTPEMQDITTKFTNDIIKCANMNIVVTTAIGTVCEREGVINRLGGFFFILLLIALPLLFTIILFQIFLGYHQQQSHLPLDDDDEDEDEEA